MKKIFTLCAFLAFTTISLTACAPGPGGALTTQQLTQAQTAAGNILQVIKTEAGLYIQQPGVDPATSTKINLAVSSLSAAVASFQALSSFGNIDQAATALLTTATSVVNILPNISAQDKVAITGAIAIIEALLPVVLPAPAVTPSSAPILASPSPSLFLSTGNAVTDNMPGTLTIPLPSNPVTVP